MKTCLALRHVAFEDLGLCGPLLRARGFDILYRNAGVDALCPQEWRDADLVVLLGGPIGLADTALYPWLADEVRAAAARLAAARPLLGICLGAQLMAAALGAPVRASGGFEIGWAPVSLTAAGDASPLRHLRGVPVLHWHGDAFDLPAGADGLARTDATPHQAFAVGRHALALQFHAEADPARIEAWLIGHTVELRSAGVDIAALRAAALRHGPAQADGGRRMLEAWLDAAFPAAG